MRDADDHGSRARVCSEGEREQKLATFLRATKDLPPVLQQKIWNKARRPTVQIPEDYRDSWKQPQRNTLQNKPIDHYWYKYGEVPEMARSQSDIADDMETYDERRRARVGDGW